MEFEIMEKMIIVFITFEFKINLMYLKYRFMENSFNERDILKE